MFKFFDGLYMCTCTSRISTS